MAYESIRTSPGKVIRKPIAPLTRKPPPSKDAQRFMIEGSKVRVRVEHVRNLAAMSQATDVNMGLTSVDSVSDLESLESWLDNHPDFVQDYFSRKATRGMIDGWLIAHSLSKTADGTSVSESGSPVGSCSSKASSGANTPVRKISAQEFEKGGQILKPMVSTVDGQLTFLANSGAQETQSTGKGARRKSKSELKALDEKAIIDELVMDICNDLDVTSLCHKILQHVSTLLNADRCSLFLVEGSDEDQCLVSKLFDVNSNSTIEECTGKCEEIRVAWGKGIAGHVAQSGQALNIPEAYQDERFNHEIDKKTGYKTRSILCMPIRHTDGQVIGVAQAVNKLSVKDEPFTDKDEKVFSGYLAFCGIGLRNAQLYEKSLLEHRRCQLMLDLARVIFEEQSNVANLIHKIMMHTQSLLQCERCQVMLVDPTYKEEDLLGIFSQVFDLQASDFDNNDTYHREGSTVKYWRIKSPSYTQEPRFPLNIGITGCVAATGQTLNIPNAYQDERFDPKVDTGEFRTRSILCMPIRNAQGNVIGVAQFVNKLDSTPFSKTDENLFEAFAIFCGMGINNTQMYEKACKAIAKQQVALECLSYHSAASQEEVDRIKHISRSAEDYHLYDFTFNDALLDDDGTLKAAVRMFQELKLTEIFNINHDMLCRWLLSVKKNYRNVTYHNWRHAFNVAQTMFSVLTMGEMRNLMTDVECLALIVGCLSHDLDHRGTNNQYQIKTMSPLATLYTTSTMEHHHFDQCIMILNTKGNEILSNVAQHQYPTLIKILENAILATDLALHFRYRDEFFNRVNASRSEWKTEEERDLLRSMMMTACDVAAISKPWKIQKQLAEKIYNEFFEQGDLEKEQLNIKPIDIMNREKKDELPLMQVGFIDGICLPVYEAFEKINKKLAPLANGCRSNRESWQKLANVQKTKQQANKGNSKPSLLPS